MQSIHKCWKGLGLHKTYLRDAALLVKIQHLMMKEFCGTVKLGYTSLWSKESEFVVHSLARYLIIIWGRALNRRLWSCWGNHWIFHDSCHVIKFPRMMIQPPERLRMSSYRFSTGLRLIHLWRGRTPSSQMSGMPTHKSMVSAPRSCNPSNKPGAISIPRSKAIPLSYWQQSKNIWWVTKSTNMRWVQSLKQCLDETCETNVRFQSRNQGFMSQTRWWTSNGDKMGITFQWIGKSILLGSRSIP